MTGSSCASTGSRCPTTNNCADSGPGSMIRCGSGSCPRWTWSRCTGWEDYSRAKDQMMVHTDTPPESLVRRRIRRQEARAAEHDRPPAVHHRLPRCRPSEGEAAQAAGAERRYDGPPRELSTYVDDHVATLMGDVEYVAATLAWCASTSRPPWPCCSSWSPTDRCAPVNGTAFAVTPDAARGLRRGRRRRTRRRGAAGSGAGVPATAG